MLGHCRASLTKRSRFLKWTLPRLMSLWRCADIFILQLVASSHSALSLTRNDACMDMCVHTIASTIAAVHVCIGSSYRLVPLHFPAESEPVAGLLIPVSRGTVLPLSVAPPLPTPSTSTRCHCMCIIVFFLFVQYGCKLSGAFWHLDNRAGCIYPKSSCALRSHTLHRSQAMYNYWTYLLCVV